VASAPSRGHPHTPSLLGVADYFTSRADVVILEEFIQSDGTFAMGCDHKPSGILWDDVDAFGVFRRGSHDFGNLRDLGGAERWLSQPKDSKEPTSQV